MSDPLHTAPMNTGIPTSDAVPGGAHRVACLFPGHAAAERAREDLVNSGVPATTIQVVEQSAAAGGTTTAGNGGMWESIKSLFTGEEAHGYYEGVNRGQVLLTVHAADESAAEHVASILERHDPIDLDAQETAWRDEGWAPGHHDTMLSDPAGPMPGTSAIGARTSEDLTDRSMLDTTDKPAARVTGSSEPALAGRATSDVTRTPGVAGGADQVIPVVEEELAVGKRTVQRGTVRVRTYVVERPVEEDVRLRDERVQIERRPVNRAAETGDEAFRERSVEMTETTEEPVISKTARVTEEVAIRTDVGERVEHVSDKTRHTQVEVEDGRTGTGIGTGTVDPNRRT